MDQLIFTNAAQGMEQSYQNLQTLQRGIIDGLEATVRAMISAYDPDAVYVVHGCAVTVDGSDYEVTAGVLFHNGELFAVAATSFTAGGGQVGVFKLNVVGIETPFANGTDYEVEQTRTIIFESAAAGTGVADFDELVDPEFANALKKSGGEMTGAINMGGNPLQNVPDPDGEAKPFVVTSGQVAENAVSSPGIFRISVIDIGDWNMDSTATKAVPLGFDATLVRAILVLIRNDDNTEQFDIDYQDAGFFTVGVGSNQVTLFRALSGLFDNANFNLTPYNRGWVTVIHA